MNNPNTFSKGECKRKNTKKTKWKGLKFIFHKMEVNMA